MNKPVGIQPLNLSAERRISPYLFGRRGVLNDLFLPIQRDLPRIGIELKILTFDYGFNPGSVPVLAPFDTQYQTIKTVRDTLIWGIVGTSTPVPDSGPAAVGPAFLFNVFHTFKPDDKQRNWFNKNVTDLEAAGSARAPMLLKVPQFAGAGDQLTVMMQNLANNQLRAQLCLLAGELL